MNKIAKNLLDIKAVFFQPNDPFTWSSGIKSPIYCDNRLTISYPEVRKNIAESLASLVNEHFNNVEVIAGTATAGIPHASLVSHELNLPMCYVRSKAKAHGKGNQIEGKVTPGQRVVVVEDLISTGGSAIGAVQALREAGCEVLGVVAIFTYGLKVANENLANHSLDVRALCDYQTLMDTAIERGDIDEQDRKKLSKWLENPTSEAWME
ncbi:orotate phosphoribosyltransferase [Sutcliffiella rhizosphaerae]|uniref:Orotate phosphoribosyltransferase n=1 Tax=Sutcliffiella rhizosphaerae TaxID=2880967 RepID=A0ABM8YIN3_9BACI|nr:orotate phosphoribosyltransferase [Sutcliffiella rhizosphaerae]CAG9619773.1 Orotate phosphoribosyltransferase [Sutcliffiella rhizosphaerae]